MESAAVTIHQNPNAAPQHAAPPSAAAPAALKPTQGDSEGRTFAPIIVLCSRGAEVAFCLIALATIASTSVFKYSSAYAYGLAAPILGMVYSLALLVPLIISLRNDSLAAFFARPVVHRTILVADFVAVILLITAAAAAATATTASCSIMDSANSAAHSSYDSLQKQYSQYLPTYESYSSSNYSWGVNCNVLRASAAFTFLAAFAYCADFWLALFPAVMDRSSVAPASPI